MADCRRRYGCPPGKDNCIIFTILQFTTLCLHGRVFLWECRFTAFTKQLKYLRNDVALPLGIALDFSSLLLPNKEAQQTTTMQSTNNNKDLGPPRKKTKHDFCDDVVTVLVGEAEKKYSIHKKVVCKTSGFFRGALRATWREATSKIVRLPTVNATSFDIYVGWLYTGEIATGGGDEDGDNDGGQTGVDGPDHDHVGRRAQFNKTMPLLINCYVLGDMLLDFTFCNTVTDETLRVGEVLNLVPRPEHVQQMWEKVPHGSNHCRLYVDTLAVHCLPDYYDRAVADYPPEFVMEIAKVCVREGDTMLSRERYPANREKCYYHEHRDETDGCAWRV